MLKHILLFLVVCQVINIFGANRGANIFLFRQIVSNGSLWGSVDVEQICLPNLIIINGFCYGGNAAKICPAQEGARECPMIGKNISGWSFHHRIEHIASGVGNYSARPGYNFSCICTCQEGKSILGEKRNQGKRQRYNMRD